MLGVTVKKSHSCFEQTFFYPDGHGTLCLYIVSMMFLVQKQYDGSINKNCDVLFPYCLHFVSMMVQQNPAIVGSITARAWPWPMAGRGGCAQE